MPGLGAEELGRALREMYSSLFSLAMPQFDRLQSPRLRMQARRSMALALSQAHKTLYDAIMRPGAGYDGPMAIVVHTPAQVRTLLDVE